MSQLRGRRSVKGGKSSVRECLQAFSPSFPLLSPLVFCFYREFFSRALLSERLEQGISQLFLEPEWALSQYPMRPKAEWAIDSEAIRARGILLF